MFDFGELADNLRKYLETVRSSHVLDTHHPNLPAGTKYKVMITSSHLVFDIEILDPATGKARFTDNRDLLTPTEGRLIGALHCEVDAEQPPNVFRSKRVRLPGK